MPEQKDLFKQKNVIVFIDGSNFYHSLYACYGINYIDILKLSEKLCTVNRNLKEVRYYYSPFIKEINSSLSEEQQRYITTIKRIPGITVIQGGKYIKKPIVFTKKIMDKIRKYISKDELVTYVEKGLDIIVAIDMLLLAVKNEYDTAILISGDGDFVPVIEKIRLIKKKVQVASFSNDVRKCYDLKNAANSFINLDHIIPIILKSKKPQP